VDSSANSPIITSETLLTPFEFAGIRLDLTRSQLLLASVGHPERRVPIVHVAGSNGKGSVCAYLSNVLSLAGYKVGCYTSPHLVSWHERICVDGVAIGEAEFVQVLKQAIRANDPADPVTQFELVTAAAWLYFEQIGVDIAIIEVGLGGRLDATNVCDRPLATVITSISREHWQLLGDTLGKIATEKAGILKIGRPAIVGPLSPEAALSVQKKATELGCPIDWVVPALGDRELHSQGLSYTLKLQGPVQRINSAIAIATLRCLQGQGWSISDDAVAQGLAQTQWPGRLEWKQWRGLPVLIDGAHNDDSARWLRVAVDGLGNGPIAWIVGMMATKDHESFLAAILRPGDRLYGVPVPDPNTVEPGRLVAIGQGQDIESQACGDVVTALELAVKARDRIVICGSLYLLGDCLRIGVFDPE
jgi:dihydrofolate synthase / folylpolyglutamate synthase